MLLLYLAKLKMKRSVSRYATRPKGTKFQKSNR